MLPFSIMENQNADTLRALWKSGRDKYRSFFRVLGEVRREVGDQHLNIWCIKELGFGYSTIQSTENLLGRVDAPKVKAEFEAVKNIEREKAKKKRKAKQDKAELKKWVQEQLDGYRLLPTAREVVRPMVAKMQTINGHDLAESEELRAKYGKISHDTYEKAKAVELSLMLERLKQNDDQSSG